MDRYIRNDFFTSMATTIAQMSTTPAIYGQIAYAPSIDALSFLDARYHFRIFADWYGGSVLVVHITKG